MRVGYPWYPPAQLWFWGKAVMEGGQGQGNLAGLSVGHWEPKGQHLQWPRGDWQPWQGTARASVGEIRHFWPRHWLPWPQTESQGAGTESEEGNGDATWYLGEEPEKHDFISGSQFYPLVRKHGLKLQQHLYIFYANCWRKIEESIIFCCLL